MGVDLKPITEARHIEMHELSGKIIAIDAFNAIHQFLSIIRQRDGTPLKDSKGRITSHLSGLLYRTANMVDAGITHNGSFHAIMDFRYWLAFRLFNGCCCNL